MTVYKPLDWQDVLPFGKYKGQGVGEVFEEDAAYLFWMMNNTEVRFAPHVVVEIERECHVK